MNDSPSSLEAINEKLDQILTYQKNAHRWAIVKAVLNFLLFFVLIVLPILWAYSFFRSVATQVDFDTLASQYSQITKTLSQLDALSKAGTINLSDLLKQINGQ